MALVLGLLPAGIAQGKGASFFPWYAYGVLLFPIALIHSLVMRETDEALIGRGRAKRCPHCQSLITPAATVCKHCSRDV